MISYSNYGSCGEEDIYTGVLCNKEVGHKDDHRYVDPNGSIEVAWKKVVGPQQEKADSEDRERIKNLHAGTQYTEAIEVFESERNNII